MKYKNIFSMITFILFFLLTITNSYASEEHQKYDYKSIAEIIKLMNQEECIPREEVRSVLVSPTDIEIFRGGSPQNTATTGPSQSTENTQNGTTLSVYNYLQNDSAFKREYKKLTLAKIAAEIRKLQQNESITSNTNAISYFIFVIAHLLLGFGIYAAYTEFKNSKKIRKKGEPEEQHEIKIGLEGIALKTSLHGTLILVITMGFYYLYLIHVYKITVL